MRWAGSVELRLFSLNENPEDLPALQMRANVNIESVSRPLNINILVVRGDSRQYINVHINVFPPLYIASYQTMFPETVGKQWFAHAAMIAIRRSSKSPRR